MFFRKRLSGLDVKIKKTAVGVLLVAIVAGSVFAGTSLRAGAYSKTQDVLNELLGSSWSTISVTASWFITAFAALLPLIFKAPARVGQINR